MLADARKRGARVALRFEGKADADDFKGVGEENRSNASEGATGEAAQGRFLTFVLDHNGAHLLVGKKLDRSVGEDA